MSNASSDHIDILNLVHRYPELIDGGDFAGIGEMFQHTTWVFDGVEGRPDHEITGRAAIEANFRDNVRLFPDGTPRTRHVITNEILEIDGLSGTAVCRYYITVFQQADTVPLQPVWANRYEDHLRRVDGAWRIVRRRGFAHMPGDTSQHLK